jgi:hypothetical protein
MRRGATKYESGADVFVTATFGIIAAIVAFGITLVLLGEATRIAMTSRTIAGGLRLIDPSAQKSDHSPERAFDGSTAADTFWEAPCPFPIELTVEFPQPKTLFKLHTKSRGDVSRTPSMWSAEGSKDGRGWMLLDQQKIEGPWEPYASREFKFGYDQPLRQLRFRFLAGFNSLFLRIYKIELH